MQSSASVVLIFYSICQRKIIVQIVLINETLIFIFYFLQKKGEYYITIGLYNRYNPGEYYITTVVLNLG